MKHHFLLGFLCAAIIFVATHISTIVAPPIEPIRLTRHIQIIDCDNLNEQPAENWQHEDTRYALERLKTSCDHEREAIALINIWAQNPAAGAVQE